MLKLRWKNIVSMHISQSVVYDNDSFSNWLLISPRLDGEKIQLRYTDGGGGGGVGGGGGGGWRSAR